MKRSIIKLWSPLKAAKQTQNSKTVFKLKFMANKDFYWPIYPIHFLQYQSNQIHDPESLQAGKFPAIHHRYKSNLSFIINYSLSFVVVQSPLLPFSPYMYICNVKSSYGKVFHFHNSFLDVTLLHASTYVDIHRDQKSNVSSINMLLVWWEKKNWQIKSFSNEWAVTKGKSVRESEKVVNWSHVFLLFPFLNERAWMTLFITLNWWNVFMVFWIHTLYLI